MLVNEVVDGGGVSYAFRLAEEMSATATDAVRAFVGATRIFDLNALWRDISALDNVVDMGVADRMMLESRRLLDRASRWLLTNRPQPLAVNAEISRFAGPVRELSDQMLTLLRGKEREHVVEDTDRLVGKGVPDGIATRVASLLDRFCLLDVIEIAEIAEREGAGAGVEHSHLETAQLYYALSEHLDMDRMLSSVSALERGNRWHALARLALRDDLYSSLRAITVDVLRHSDPDDSADDRIARWEQSNASRLGRARSALDEIRRANRLDLPTLSVAARQVRAMVR
jgi:glutamate dehydrogenase